MTDLLQRPCNKALLDALPEPKAVWKYFLLCTEFPRMSHSIGGDLKPLIAKLVKIAEPWGCTHTIDAAGNLILRKPASPGHEHAPGIIIQCHLDMVCSANASTQFDFAKEPINCEIVGDLLKAKGTTLGADDGIGVAACLALLEDSSVPHGPLECLFTIDEETTMSGAEHLSADVLKGDIVINVDSEEDNAICIGCAGGFECTLELAVTRSTLPFAATCFRVGISGLQGGHTGVDIHRGRGNAIQLLGQVLSHHINETQIEFLEVEGGGALNVIPREAHAVVITDPSKAAVFQKRVKEMFEDVKAQFKVIEPNLTLSLTEQAVPATSPCDKKTTQKILDIIAVLPHGPLRMNPELPAEVESSISFSRMKLEGNVCSFLTFSRSSSESQMKKTYAQLKALGRIGGIHCSAMLNAFPSWQPNATGPALKIIKSASEAVYGKPARVYSVHAGLECGFILGKYPKVECVSIGPLIENAHSPDEQLHISSVPKFYSVLRNAVAEIAKTKK